MKNSGKINSVLILPGSVEYMAPCMFKTDRGSPIVYLDFSIAVDIWTFGILLYELKNGKTPFSGQDPQTIREQIERGVYSFTGSCSAELQNLIKIILVKEPTARPTIKQIRQHSFFRGVSW